MSKDWGSGADLSANPERLLFAISRQNLAHSETDLISLSSVVSGISRLFRFIEFTSTTLDPQAENVRHYQYAAGIPALDLLKSGCQLGSADQPDCMSACMDPMHTFASTSTLANCVTLASAEVLIQRGSLRWPLDKDDMAELESFGVDDLRDLNGTAVLKSVSECAMASCQVKDGLLGNCSASPSNIQRVELGGSWSPSGLQVILMHYCDGIDVKVNADVAGPGVLLSHISQTLIVLVAYGLMNILNSWAYPVLVVGSLSGYPGTIEGALQHHQTFRQSAVNSALLSAAVEFQEAQTFFTAAVQIATLVTFKSSCGSSCAALDTLSSISESIMNSQLVRILAVNSVLPVLLMQSVLQRVGMGWWYTLMLTLGNCVLAIVIDNLEILAPTMETVWNHLRNTQKVQQCGNNPSLQAFCLTSIPQLVPRSLQSAKMAYIYPVVTILLVNQTLLRSEKSRISLWLRQRAWMNGSRMWWMRRMIRVIWGFVEFLVMVNLAVHASTLRGIAEELGISVWNRWSYGQVVASMVWAPILGKFLYYNFFGVKHAFEAHLVTDHHDHKAEDTEVV
ncbi:hypothetical protein QBC40DRAFT_273685 [Triangularia verruculosa]|uniref:Uncharacterized protein n=1 Tax=Triangularia verruculosa TaxID=2587418 RepID=A0AAN6XP84_9PEZI|nr:hypothetical protein QBC40DRAFT_273685 [Triangularia verruculosa]